MSDLQEMGPQIDRLHGQVDLLIEKLARAGELLRDIETRFNELPSQDEIEDFARAIPSPDRLREFAEVWASDALPTIDELNEYTRAASGLAAGLQAVE